MWILHCKERREGVRTVRTRDERDGGAAIVLLLYGVRSEYFVQIQVLSSSCGCIAQVASNIHDGALGRGLRPGSPRYLDMERLHALSRFLGS